MANYIASYDVFKGRPMSEHARWLVGFPGTGFEEFAGRHRSDGVMLTYPAIFDRKDFAKRFSEHIESQIQFDATTVMSITDTQAVDVMLENKLKMILLYPTLDAKDHIIKNLRDCGLVKDFVEMIAAEFEQRIAYCDALPVELKARMKPGQSFDDVIHFNPEMCWLSIKN